MNEPKTELIFRVDVACCRTWSPLFCLFQGTHRAAEYVAHLLTRRGLVCEITNLDVDEKFAIALTQAEFKVWPPLETDDLCEMIWDKSLWQERDRWAEVIMRGVTNKDEARRRFARELQESND